MAYGEAMLYSTITRDAALMFIGGLIAMPILSSAGASADWGNYFEAAVGLALAVGAIYLVRRVLIWTRLPK
jgi:hypothetical protein